jgi:excisionase family DNA binding protein
MRHFSLIPAPILPLMNITQCAEYLDISPDTLYKYATQGFVPAFKMGNRWRFSRVAIDEWISSKSRENIKEPK